MTSSPQPRRSVFGEAESRLRRVVLAAGLGFVAWVVGTALVAALVDPLVLRLPDGSLDLPEVGRVSLYALTLHLWMFTTLPPLAWLTGRLSLTQPLTFATLAGLGGELFAVMSETAVTGLEGWVPTQWHLIAVAIAFGLGVLVCTLAGVRGQSAASKAQAMAARAAAQRQAEIGSFTQAPADSSQAPPADDRRAN